MKNNAQSLMQLAAANAELVARLAQSPEVAELARLGASRYFELAQSTVGLVVASDTHADLVRRLSESYLSFAQDYADSLAEAAGPIALRSQFELATHRFESWGRAAADAGAGANQRTDPPRAT